VARVVNLARALQAVQAAGVWTYGAVGEGGEAPERLDLARQTALVLGSEGSGLRPGTLAGCDARVTIPMAAGSESLNVAAAAAVCLYEASREIGL
jgi:23S rRNA (guanosine2251-2'-O)-methyltransferase